MPEDIKTEPFWEDIQLKWKVFLGGGGISLLKIRLLEPFDLNRVSSINTQDEILSTYMRKTTE